MLNRLGFERVGDISWPEHVSIFTTPFRIAAALGIPLIFYGENPQNQYGGPQGSEQALEMTRRWRSEFGGFLGMRPSDLVGELGITERDMADYEMPSEEAMRAVGVEAHFLGQYFEWDSARNLDAAVTAGMKVACPTPANWWAGENLDCAFTGLHDHGMYRKFGYGRGAAQISVDIRHGRITRESALQWARTHDGLFPWFYCGVSLSEMLAALSVDDAWLDRALERFTNRELFEGIEDRRPMLLPGGWE